MIKQCLCLLKLLLATSYGVLYTQTKSRQWHKCQVHEWTNEWMNGYLPYLRYSFAIYFELVPQPDEDVFSVSVCVMAVKSVKPTTQWSDKWIKIVSLCPLHSDSCIWRFAVDFHLLVTKCLFLPDALLFAVLLHVTYLFVLGFGAFKVTAANGIQLCKQINSTAPCLVL